MANFLYLLIFGLFVGDLHFAESRVKISGHDLRLTSDMTFVIHVLLKVNELIFRQFLIFAFVSQNLPSRSLFAYYKV